MAKSWTHRKACRFCNSRAITHTLRYTFTPPCTSFITPQGGTDVAELIPLIMSVCEKCKLVQMLDVVDPSVLYTRYPHANFTTPDLVSHFDNYAQEAVSRGHVQPGDLVVDIGCGDGTLLRAFRKLGMTVVGVDPSQHAITQAKADGITIYGELFTPATAGRIAAEHGRAALITANFTFGSVDNSYALVAGVRHMLKQNGLFYVEEPYLADVLSQNLFDVIHHERLSFVTATSFEPFLRGTRMHLVDARRNRFRSGSVTYVVQRSDGPHVVSSSLDSFCRDEQASAIHGVDTHAAFAARVEELKSGIKKLVSDLKADGKKIAGYGASARTVTFLHECGWQADMLDFIVDDDPYKHGLVMPGTSVKVVSPDSLLREKPDVTVMFAYNYADHILKSHEEYRAAGGRFIVPFPTPRFV